jgi:hypothetical protein
MIDGLGMFEFEGGRKGNFGITSLVEEISDVGIRFSGEFLSLFNPLFID